MLQAFSSPRDRRRSAVLAAGGLALAVAAAVAGISDNPPGLILALLAVAALTLALTHPWREPVKYRRLLIAAGVGFFAGALLHNGLHAVASLATPPGLVHDVLEGFGVFFFFVAILICPPVFLVATLGALLTSWAKRTA